MFIFILFSRNRSKLTFFYRLSYVFIIGKGNKPYVSLPRGKGVKLSIAEERAVSASIGLVMGVATVASGGIAAVATTGIKTGITYGMKQGMKATVRATKQSVKQLLFSFYS